MNKPKNNIDRRTFLETMATGAGIAIASSAMSFSDKSTQTRLGFKNKKPPSIGLALGAGGANGLAHLLMLEVFDELDLRPQIISGCSTGAFFAVLYAAGWNAKKIRNLLFEVIPANPIDLQPHILDFKLLKLLESLEPSLSRGGLVSGARILNTLLERVEAEHLEELEIPVKLVTTDYWNSQQVVYNKGPINKLLAASMAAPGAFAAVQYDSRILVDGGLSNPLPYDLIAGDVDVVIAIDAIGRKEPSENRNPGVFDTMFHSIQILRENIVARQIEATPPTIYIRPEIVNIRMLDVIKIKSILEQAEPAKTELKMKLKQVLKEYAV